MSDAGGNVEGPDAGRPKQSAYVGDARRAWMLWGAGSAFVLLLMLLFYPKAVVLTDEGCYLSGSRYLLSGKAFDRSSEAWFWKDHGIRERTLFSASPVFSALLVPFVAAGWRSSFLLGTMAHVLAFGGMIYVLRRRGLSPRWALLYLLYPTAILYSRTIMVDVVSAALVVLMLVVLHRERPSYFAAGLVMGFAMLLKLSNLPVVASFAVVTFLEDLSARRTGRGEGASTSRVRWVWMGLGMLPGLALLAAVNTVFFNRPLGNGYIGMSEGYFRWGFFVEHFPFYLVCLMVLYPFMLVSPAFLRGRYRWEMGVACFAALVFFSFYFFVDRGNAWYESMVRGVRFHLTVLPFYILGYGYMITALMGRIASRGLVSSGLAAAILLVGAGDALIGFQHGKHATREWERQKRLDTVLPAGGTVAVCVMAVKYLNAAAHPELRILRLTEPCELPYVVRESALPALLVLMDPAGIRTKAYQAGAIKEREDMLRKAAEFYETRKCERRVQDFECRVLARRVTPAKPIWRPLPLGLSEREEGRQGESLGSGNGQTSGLRERKAAESASRR